MSLTKCKTFLWVGCAAWLGAVVAAAVPVRADGAAVLEKTGIRGGVVCVIGAGQTDLALDLARQPGFLVLAMDEDAARVTQMREKAASDGTLGRSLYVEQGAIDRIPFADNYVDLLITSDEGRVAKDEIIRVLTPIHGRAIVGGETIRKPELPGSDWWTHKRHLPDNNPVSRDTIFQFPPLTQFRALPMNDSGHGAGLTANAIKYEIYDWAMAKTGQTGVSGRMVARNIYNGRIIWDRLAPGDILPSAPILAATDEALWVASGSAAEVLRFDALTGAPLPPIVLGDEERRVKWLALEEHKLFALIGGIAKLKEPFSFYVPPPPGQWENRELFGDELVVWDLAANREVWRHDEGNLIDDTNVALRDGRLYFYSDEERLACFEAATGKEIWSNDDDAWIAKLKRPPRKPHNIYTANTPHMIVADDLVCFNVAEGRLTLIFSARDGQLLAETQGDNKMLVKDGTLYLGQRAIDLRTGERLDDASLPSPAGVAWCGLTSYCQGTGVIGHSTLGFKSACAQGVWVAGGILLYSPTVCNCDTLPGAVGFASGGALLDRIKQVPEHPLVKGPTFGAIGPRSAAPGDWPQYRANARRQGASPVAVSDTASLAWTVAPARPFAYTKDYNQYTLTFDDRPVPPVTADGKVFTAASDGVVSTLSLADGKRLWTFATGGPVMTSPAWDRGYLFVPSGDGWLYALDANTGTLAWKRRVAPLERRICVFDKLVSNWPVAAVLVADGEVFATAGMMHTDGVISMALDPSTGDIRWSKFTPPSRESLQGSHQPPDRPVYGLGGGLAKAGERIWFTGHHSPPLVLDEQSGTDHRYERISQLVSSKSYYTFKKYFYSQGKDIVVLDDDVLLIGGGPLWMQQQMREGKRWRTSFNVFLLDDSGDWVDSPLPMVALRFCRIAPACDDDMFVFAGPPPWKPAKRRDESPDRDSGAAYDRTTLNTNVQQATLGLNAWDRVAFLSDARQLQLQSPYDEETMQKRPGQVVFKRLREGLDRPLAHEQAAWSRDGLDVSSVALAANAVVAAHATGHRELKSSERLEHPRGASIRYDGWQVSAFDRQNGQPLWSVPLPEEPLYDGLAIAADGTIVLALRDGTLMGVGL